MGGLAGYQVLLRTGLFADGTAGSEVPLFDATGEYDAFGSRWHRLAAWLVGFLGGGGRHAPRVRLRAGGHVLRREDAIALHRHQHVTAGVAGLFDETR